MKGALRFWVYVILIWLFSTGLDRIWWNSFDGIPAWDQADYLNSALDHGRALGLLHGEDWKGWPSLFDLSPKIPPLASMVNGTVMALVGDDPNDAAWSLSIWHGLLIFAVGGWALRLRDEGLALVAVVLVAFSPALLELRSDYVLEMPLTAAVTLALWRLGCWWDPSRGRSWGQALTAAFACLVAILVKQSALLALFGPLVWSSWVALRHSKKTRYQLFAGFVLILGGLIPWFHHNWITAIGGTNRAVIESAVREGDPSLLTIDNWIWYLRILPEQLGIIFLFVGISGCFLWLFNHCSGKSIWLRNDSFLDDSSSWKWLLFSLLLGWLFTSLSPNKGDRYITPLLPALIIFLARGSIQWWLWLRIGWLKNSFFSLPIAFITGFLVLVPVAWKAQISRLADANHGPLEELISAAGGADSKIPLRTVIIVPSTPDLNQHNVSFYGRRNGGNLVGRQLGNHVEDIDIFLSQGNYVVLAEGDQGSIRETALLFDNAVRTSGIFYEVNRFPRPGGGSYSLWKRRSDSRKIQDFSVSFPKLATGMASGLNGLQKVFSVISVQHMLDGHFEYRSIARERALNKLLDNPNDLEANWTLSLLSILANRPDEASSKLSRLEELMPNNPWPSVYRTVVLLADWKPWTAVFVAENAQKRNKNVVLIGLRDLSSVVGGAFWRWPVASRSIPRAYKEIEQAFRDTP